MKVFCDFATVGKAFCATYATRHYLVQDRVKSYCWSCHEGVQPWLRAVRESGSPVLELTEDELVAARIMLS